MAHRVAVLSAAAAACVVAAPQQLHLAYAESGAFFMIDRLASQSTAHDGARLRMAGPRGHPASTIPSSTRHLLRGLAPLGSLLSAGMTVSWKTAVKTATHVVQYGRSPDGLNQTASAANATSYVSGGGFHHHVTIGGLPPATTFYYRAGDAADGFSDVATFTTAPTAATAFPFSVTVFGDMVSLLGRSNLVLVSASLLLCLRSPVYPTMSGSVQLRGLVQARRIGGCRISLCLACWR
jgi:hypothetical protein